MLLITCTVSKGLTGLMCMTSPDPSPPEGKKKNSHNNNNEQGRDVEEERRLGDPCFQV